MDERTTRPRIPDRVLLAAGVAVALLLACLVCVSAWRAEKALIGEWGLALDDAWIHATIARNLADGHGWSYNPGVPVQNSSGPLWTALVALGFLIFGPSVWVPKVLGVVCLAGCIVFAARLVWMLTRDVWAAVPAAVFAALGESLTWHGLSGMETPLAALLVIAALDCFYRWETGRKRFTWALLAAFAVTARPETALLLPVLAAERWLRQRDRAAWRDGAIAAGLCAAILVPYFALNLSLSGSIFPTTFAAKAGQTGLFNALEHADWRELLVSLSLYPYVWTVHTVSYVARENVAIWILAVVGAWSLARGPRRAWAPAIVLVLLPLLRGVGAPHALPHVHYGRYVGCLLPLICAAAGAGLGALVRGLAPWAAPTGLRRFSVLALAAVAGLAIVAAIRFESRIPDVGPSVWESIRQVLPGGDLSKALPNYTQFEKAGLAVLAATGLFLIGLVFVPRRGVQVAGIVLGVVALFLAVPRARNLPPWYARNVRSIHEMDVELGKWIATAVPPGETVAVNDIGAIGFFGRRPLVDAIGLATPELTPYQSARRLRTLIAMRRLRPKYFVLFPSWFPEWTNRPSLFTPLMRHTVDDKTFLGEGAAIVYRADWDHFDRYYSDALLEKIDPVPDMRSLRAHWRRGLDNLFLQTRSELYTQAGDDARARHDVGAAEAAYRKAIAIEPRERGAWLGLLHVLATKRDGAAYATAIQDMVRALPAIDSDILAKYADWQFATGQVEATAQTLETALALHPDGIGVLSKLADYWTRRGDVARAAEYKRTIEELTPRMRLEPGAAAGAQRR